MFTGIVEETGIIKNINKGVNSSVLTITGKIIFDDLKVGASVAVNGVCLTVTARDNCSFTADVMHETLRRSSLAMLKTGSRVDLERAMPANGRFGGHIVSGHIDGVGQISKIERDDNAIWYTVRTDEEIMKYIVEKGSVTIDGISLTVAKVNDNDFSVSVIPHTAKSTVLSDRTMGSVVNLENDIVGKYIEKLMCSARTEKNTGARSGGITKEFLREAGF